MLLVTALVWAPIVTVACLCILAFSGVVSLGVSRFVAAVEDVNAQREGIRFYRPGVTPVDAVALAETRMGRR
jgi:hypothetical protein